MAIRDNELRERVDAWISESRKVSAQQEVTELIGDFYEFAEFYFMLHGRRDFLFGLMHDCYVNSGEFTPKEDFEKIRAYEDANHPEFEPCFMLAFEAIVKSIIF